MSEWLCMLLGFGGVLAFTAVMALALDLHKRHYFAKRPVIDDTSFSQPFTEAGIPPHIPAVVRRIVGSFLELPYAKIDPELNLEDPVPYLSSLDWATAFMEIETELGVTVPPADAERVRPNLRSWIEIVTEVYRRQHSG
jgi:acyl carrier protein